MSPPLRGFRLLDPDELWVTSWPFARWGTEAALTPILGPPPRAKSYHYGQYITADGRVSARCFKRPHAIDLKRASWTIIEAAVTCPRCRALPMPPIKTLWSRR